ncbi:hypothetical protein DFJ63DRAFT_329362 [Scheffersomyces coipomensis]|uniref:uncharacterized protein n=1 Tax=Scheffersomyces coipomensis TaxID=1788519 RepID=UPI00315DCE7B
MSDLNIGSSNQHQQQHTSAALLEQLVYIDTFMNNNSGGSTGDLTPNLDIDGQLSIDLAAFADDSFIFPDEDKPKNHNGKGHHHDDDDDDMDLDNLHHINHNNNNNNHNNNSNNNNNGQRHIKSEAEDPLLSSNFASSTDSSPNYQSNHLHNPSQLVLANTFTNSNGNTNNNSNQDSILDDINISKLPKFPVPPGAKSSLVSAGLSQNQIDLLSALIAQHQTRLGNPVPNNSSTTADFPHLPSQNFNSPVRQHNQLQSFSSTDEGVVASSSSLSSNNNNSGEGINFDDSPISMTSSSTTLQASPSLTMRTPSSDELLSRNEFGGMTAEVDKRRRNTAASARFRIKKKLKEKQMEHRIFSLNELIKEFEIKIQQLEMENKLLRNLIIEKGSQKSDNELKLLRERAKLN